MKYYALILLLTQISLGWGASLKVGITSSPNNLNPFFSSDAYSQNINRLVHISLIDVDRNMKPICQACVDFKERILEDGKYQIHFTLGDDLRFWDGLKVKLSDIENSIALFKNEREDLKSIFRFAFASIKRIKKLSENKFYLEYESYAPNYITDLTLLKILRIDEGKIIGAGPYQVMSRDPFRVLLKSVVDTSSSIEFKVVKDETTMVLKLKNKEIDLIAGDISQRKLDYALKQIKGIKTWKASGTNYNYIMFNMNSALGGNEEFRKFVQNNLNVENFIKYKLQGKATSSQGFISKSFSKYFVSLPEHENKEFKFESKEEINFLIGNNLTSKEFAHYFKNKLENIGIKVKVQSYEWGVLKKRLTNGQFDMFLGSWIGFTDPSIIKYALHSKSIPPNGANRGHFVSKDLDRILDEAMVTLDNKKLFAEAQKVINKEIPYLSLWHPTIIWMGRDCLKVPSLYSNGSFLSFKEISNKDCVP
jgi:peptide/nickel transport system substrate-binding protein